MLAAVGLCSAAQAYKSVSVNLVDGSKVEVNLTDGLSATFDDENLLITGIDNDIAVLRSSIKSFAFSEDEYSGVDCVKGDVSGPALIGGTMVFSDLPEGSFAAVYAANGALVSQAAVSGSYTLDLSTLPAGTAIVNVNGVAYKIAIRK